MAMRAAFGVCAIARNEARYIQEWVAFHRLQGASQIVVFDNDSDDGTLELLRSARGWTGISAVRWTGGVKDFDVRQRAAYQEAAYIMVGKVDFSIFIDIDEFVYAREGTLDCALGAVPESVGAIAIGQRVFGSSGQRRFRHAPVTVRFKRCVPLGHPETNWFKTAARPELIERFDSVHSVVLRSGQYVMSDGSPLVRSGIHPGHAKRAVDGQICLNHYMLKSREEYRWKQQKWRPNAMASRYSEEYFQTREKGANIVWRRPPCSRDVLDQVVDHIWGGQVLTTQDGPYRYGWKQRLIRAYGGRRSSMSSRA